nr:hypothetical protein [Tanacetum cinerariifolium]
GEGSANPTEPHHTPSPQEHHSPQHDSPPPLNQTIISELMPQASSEILTPRRYTRRAIQIAQSKALSPTADEPVSLSINDRQGEAFPTISSLDAGQDKENIAKTSAMPHESSSRISSLGADEGSMQQRIHELMELCTSLQRQQSHMAAKIKDQDLEISGLKERVKSLKDKERRRAEPTQKDAPITRGIIDIGEELGAEKSTKLGSNDTKEMEQIDAQVARKMEEEFARENQKLSKQLVRDSEIARRHAEEELKIMIEGLDKSNEVIAKHLSEYEQAEAGLSVGEKIELIRELSEYWKIIRLGGHTAVYQFFVDMLKQFDRDDLHQLWTLVKETFSTKQATRDKEKELWVELKRLFKPDFEDQLWTYHQAFMHDPLDWKLYDTCGVHHMSTKDQEIFMLVEKDYPLRKGLATVMIIQDEELIKASSPVMSSDSHATITYTSMSSYEVIVNGYFGMPMDPLDLYVQLIMEAPPSPDYILGPEAPPSPDYIPGPEYQEYLSPADDVLPAKEQPLPAAVLPTAESPGYITDSELEMEPEEEDGDDEKSEEVFIEYPTSRGDDDADDNGDDLLEDDDDDEDKEESSDSKDEEEENLALTILAPALHSSIPAFEDSDETEPFEEGKTTATPPPFGYRVAARIPVQPHILMPFPPRSRTQPIGTPPLLPIPLPLSSFPLPLLLPSTSGSESVPEADIPLRKRARFTTPTGAYEVGESFVTAAARQIRPALTIIDYYQS